MLDYLTVAGQRNRGDYSLFSLSRQPNFLLCEVFLGEYEWSECRIIVDKFQPRTYIRLKITQKRPLTKILMNDGD